MKKIICVLVLMLCISCGRFEKIYDDSNYESLTNEYVNIECYSGGVVVKRFNYVKIIYSDADSQSVLFTDGKEKRYWQGDAYIEIKRGE